ncbi:MAG: serine hydrolase domain-containing protein [Mangrovibacterium sp.]
MSRIKLKILFALIMLFPNIKGIAENRTTITRSFPSQDSVSLLFEEAVKASGLPAAVAVAIDKTGQMVRYTYGKAVWNENERVTENHIFRIYSMTKLITSVAVLQLVEKRLIGLDDDLSSLMPEMTAIPILSDGELRMGENPVTLRALLTHTSGFGYVTTDRQLDEFDASKWNFRDLPRRFESGTRFLYGTGLNWVGRIVEKISGTDLETYCRKQITGPLEMNRTWFNVPDSLKSFIVSRGQWGSEGIEELPDRIPEKVVTDFNGGGGLFSSPADFTKLLYCLLNGGTLGDVVLLREETVGEMIRNQIGDIVIDIEHAAFKEHCCDFRGLLSKTTKWGFGWAIDNEDRPNGRRAGTVFWGGSMNTYFYIDFKSGIVAGIYAQYYPFNHAATINLFEKFSEIIYSAYKKQ